MHCTLQRFDGHPIAEWDQAIVRLHYIETFASSCRPRKPAVVESDMQSRKSRLSRDWVQPLGLWEQSQQMLSRATGTPLYSFVVSSFLFSEVLFHLKLDTFFHFIAL